LKLHTTSFSSLTNSSMEASSNFSPGA
jgi:hypothetical protein